MEGVDRLMRYGGVLLSQFFTNREYFYFWTLATILDVVIFTATSPLAWSFFAIANLFFGLLAIVSIVRPVDKAFESIGLDYSKGYGKPVWIIEGKYPAKTDSYRIRAAGYEASDFEKYIGHISSRINQPVKEIRKPLATVPEIEVILKRSNLPSTLLFSALSLSDLKQGDFYLGQSDDKLETLNLSNMIHMLVAGQTGSGKTQFLKQFITTILTQSRSAFVALIDMKGGIDFQGFSEVQNFQMVTNHESATLMLDQCIELFNLRKDYLLKKKKTNWSELQLKELEKEESLKNFPIGPVVVVVDELAELSKKATEKSSKAELQEKIATLARLSRFTGIHLVLGTQRPDKNTLDMQSKDNLPTRVCFAVTSVAASTLVIGDMTASTLGSHSGRAVFQLSGNKIIQAPLIKSTDIEQLMTTHKERLAHAGFSRSLTSDKMGSQEIQEENPLL